MVTKIGINGFGRIGRQVLKAINEFHGDDLQVVAINDLFDTKTNAHLFKYDSTYGRYKGTVEVKDNDLVVDGEVIKVFAERDPGNLPWKDLGVEVVLESTGKFTDRAGAAQHLAAGARNVLVSAPAKGGDLTFVIGVNDSLFDKAKHQVVSIGSCTTNCLAPVAKVLDDLVGIERGFMTTIHAYTNDQKILDLPHKDLRRARAAGMSMIPTSTGAAKAIGEVLPGLKGKLDGLAVRVPTPDGSLVDLVVQVKKDTTKEAINAAMKAAAEGPMKGVLEYCTEPIVSIDVVGNPHSSVFDSLSTNVMGGNLVKVLSWYDNEWGFSQRVVDALLMMA